VSSAMRRPAFRSLIRRRTPASRAVTLRWAKRRSLRVVSSANQRSTRFSRDELSDLQPRPVYHRKRDSVVARLTIVFAALAATRPIEARTGWSIRNSSRPPAAAAPSRSRPDGRPSPLPTPSPPTCAKPSAPLTAPADLRTRTAQLRTASISPAPRTDRTQPTPAPGALAAPGPAGLAGVEGKPIRGARPTEMIAAPHWPAPDHPVAVPGALPRICHPGHPSRPAV
jgi:hypothetical protein